MIWIVDAGARSRVADSSSRFLDDAYVRIVRFLVHSSRLRQSRAGSAACRVRRSAGSIVALPFCRLQVGFRCFAPASVHRLDRCFSLYVGAVLPRIAT